MSPLLTRTFWTEIAWSLARTTAAGLVPFVPGLLADPTGTWAVTVLTVALTLVLTVATALVSVPDPDAAPWWQVATTRALRQLGQMVVAGATGAVLVTDVDWATVLNAAGASALATLILAAVDAIPTTSPAPVVDATTQPTTLPVLADPPVLTDTDRAALVELRAALADTTAPSTDPAVTALDHILT